MWKGTTSSSGRRSQHKMAGVQEMKCRVRGSQAVVRPHTRYEDDSRDSPPCIGIYFQPCVYFRH